MLVIHTFYSNDLNGHTDSESCHCEPHIIVNQGYINIVHETAQPRLFEEWTASVIQNFSNGSH